MKRVLWAIDADGDEAVYVNGKFDRTCASNVFWGDLANSVHPATLFELEMLALKVVMDEWPSDASELPKGKRKVRQ